MAIEILTIGSLVSNTGWTNPLNAASSDDVRGTCVTAGSVFAVELEDVPADFGSTNTIELSVEWSLSGTASRTKSLLVELWDAPGIILLHTFTTPLFTSLPADTSHFSGPLPSGLSAAELNGARLRVTMQEGGGMGDSIVVRLDHVFVTLDYDVAVGGVTLVVADLQFAHTLDSPTLLVPPPAPTLQEVDPVSSGGIGFDMVWSDVANEDGYYIHRSEVEGFTPSDLTRHNGPLPADINAGDDFVDVQAGVTYYFVIEAFNAAGSSYSNELSGTVYYLAPADLAHAHTLESPALVIGGVTLAVDDMAFASALDEPVLSAVPPGLTLTVADLAHAHNLDALSLLQANILVTFDLVHAHSIDSPSLVEANVLTVLDLQHLHSMDGVVLSAGVTLIVGDIRHAHSLDTLVLVQAHTLSVADTRHATISDLLSLVQAHFLAPNDLVHSLVLEEPVLLQASTLAVQDLQYVHALDSIDLASGTILAVADARHAHALDVVALIQAHLLNVQGIMHTHSLDAPILGSAYALTVSDISFAHLLDSPSLTTGFALAPQDMRHTHSLENLILTQSHVLSMPGLQHSSRFGHLVLLTGDQQPVYLITRNMGFLPKSLTRQMPVVKIVTRTLGF